MKNTLNTKKILKATIAFSGILLFGCAPVSENGVDYYEEDTQVVSYEPVQERTVQSDVYIEDNTAYDDDVLFLTDEDISDDQFEIVDASGYEDEGPIVLTEEQISVAASTPAAPRVVPIREEKNCPTCTKKAKATPTVTAEIAEDEEIVFGNEGLGAVMEAAPVEENDGYAVLDKTIDGDDEEANLKAERDRLKKELESLTTERKSLEDEQVRITQIQQSNTEACDEVKDWVAAEGTTLRSLLIDWGNHVGWRVVWNMDRDYTLEAGAIFRGRFVEVASALLRSFARAVPAPKGVFYKGNKVLVVSTREDENAD